MADRLIKHFTKEVYMADYRDAKVHDWWRDPEYKEYYALLETIEGQLRLITTTVQETTNE